MGRPVLHFPPGQASKLADGALYRAQPDEVKRLQGRAFAIDDELLAAMTRWEELETKTAQPE